VRKALGVAEGLKGLAIVAKKAIVGADPEKAGAVLQEAVDAEIW